jgi:hypothetical protein
LQESMGNLVSQPEGQPKEDHFWTCNVITINSWGVACIITFIHQEVDSYISLIVHCLEGETVNYRYDYSRLECDAVQSGRWKEPSSSVFRVQKINIRTSSAVKMGADWFLWNICTYLPNYVAVHPRRLYHRNLKYLSYSGLQPCNLSCIIISVQKTMTICQLWSFLFRTSRTEVPSAKLEANECCFHRTCVTG